MVKRKSFHLRLPSRVLELGPRTLVMGVLNITPDSFSDGGLFLDPARAVARALELEAAGADLLDVGAESTRPGAEAIPADQELARLLPVLRALRGRLKIPVSVDTQKSQVARAAIATGAELINDVSGLLADPLLAEIAARAKVGLILMHQRGTPRTMQKQPFARNVLKEVLGGWRRSLGIARGAGVARSRIVLDPGIGFGKSFAQNFELLGKLSQLAAFGYPLLVGTSRKGFIGAALAGSEGPAPPGERLWGTAATVTATILGGAHIVRVHDLPEMARLARVADCLLDPGRVGRL